MSTKPDNDVVLVRWSALVLIALIASLGYGCHLTAQVNLKKAECVESK